MPVRLIQPPICLPLTLEQVKTFLNVDHFSDPEKMMVEGLIEAVATESENETGRVWVESKWEWSVDGGFKPNTLYELPICPVTKVEIYDNDEVVNEGEQLTDLFEGAAKVALPSLSPMGTPLVGSLLAVQEFPSNCSVILTVGYPVKEIEVLVPQSDSPVLDQYKISYRQNKIHLVWNRPVEGRVQVDNFTVEVNGNVISPNKVEFEKGGITITLLDDFLQEDVGTKLSYTGGFVYDVFQNYVEPIFNVFLPNVKFTEEEFKEPEPNPVCIEFESLAPKQAKQWMLIRLGTLFSQRSEIPDRGVGAMYPVNFINGLLKQLKVNFA